MAGFIIMGDIPAVPVKLKHRNENRAEIYARFFMSAISEFAASKIKNSRCVWLIFMVSRVRPHANAECCRHGLPALNHALALLQR